MDEELAIETASNPYAAPATLETGQTVDGVKSQRSALILVVAIVNFIYAIPPLLMLLLFGFSMGMLLLNSPEAFTGKNLTELLTMVISDILPYIFFATFGFLLSGIGLIYRKQWARILSLVLALIMLCGGLAMAGYAYTATDPSSLLPLLINMSIFMAHPIITFSILLQKKYAAEFTKNIATKSEQPA
ncbi:MAG: hypothetical protein COA78_10520 [Blastopirellula sp.]|nr:MAG: hypothetical protein COA78_10520 [Blastopirellula sp.]